MIARYLTVSASLMRGIKLQRETEVEHGITLIRNCTFTYRVPEFREHGITSGSICTFTYRVPESGAVRRFRTRALHCARRFLRREPECVRVPVSPRRVER